MTTNVAMNEIPDIFPDLPFAACQPVTILPSRLESKLFFLRVLFQVFGKIEETIAAKGNVVLRHISL